MVYKIILQLINKSGSTETVRVEYECRNLQNFDFNVSMPTSAMGLPEEFFEEAVIVKAEGNTGKLNFNWTVKEEDTTPYNIITSWRSLWPDTDYPHSNIPTTTTYYSRKIKQVGSTTSYQSYDLKTADGQMISLSEFFEKKGISSEDKHRFVLYNVDSNYNIFKQDGMITRISFQKSGTDPVTWNASLEFTLGNVLDASV